MEINLNGWNVVNKLEDCPPLSKKVLAISCNRLSIAMFQRDATDKYYLWEEKSDLGLGWSDIFSVDAWVSFENLENINLSVIPNEIRKELELENFHLKEKKEIGNYVEVLLWGDISNEGYLIGKYADNVKELLDDIALIQNLYSEIYHSYDIPIKTIVLILIDKFGCISNCVNLMDNKKINDAVGYNSGGPIDDLYLLSDPFLILEPKIKNMHLFSMNIDNLWENYSIWRYQEDPEDVYKNHIEDKELCHRIKRFIYYGMMNDFIKHCSNSDEVTKKLDTLAEILFPDMYIAKRIL